MLSPTAGRRAASERAPAAGAGPRLLDMALADASPAEIRQVLEGLYAGDRPLDRPDPGSMAYRSLVLLANKELRAVLLARNPVEQARAAAGLARLRERLLLRCLDAGGATTDAEPQVAPAAVAEPALSVENGIRAVYELLVRRAAADTEIEIWKRNFDDGLAFHEFLLRMQRGEEARRVAARTLLAEQSDARFVQTVYETIVGRGVHPRDLESWVERLRGGSIGRDELVATLLKAAVAEREAISVPHDGLSCRIMGTSRHFSAADWTRRDEELQAGAPPAPAAASHSRFHIRSEPRPLVTAIASLYRGAEFVEQFLDNLVGQTIFDDYCELVIVDAASPDGEGSAIERYVARHPNIRYLRMDYRIGIYDAWNVGIEQARGEYLTNTNLDDLRRADSLELQAATLENLPFVDVVYQDFLYTFEPHGSPERAAAFDIRSNLPIVTPYNMLSFNSPHNAPMWRRRLHDELGLFDTNFRSAGDYEFWLRCVAAGKVFYKLNDPHVIYFQNPKGLSTRTDSRGAIESREIQARYAARLTDELMTMERGEFDRRFGVNAPADPGRYPPDRYSEVQRRLRQAARALKFPS